MGLNAGVNTYAYVQSDPLTGIDPNGLVKLILFNFKDFRMYDAANRDADSPDLFQIYTHGNDSQIGDFRGDSGVRLGPADAAELIRKSGLWRPGMTILVKACEVGKGDNSFDQQLANLLDTPVIGPDGYLSVLPSRSGGYGFGPIYSWFWYGFHGSTGSWTTSLPRKK